MKRDPDKPPTEISYPPYSPTPSEIEAHKGKAARIEAWAEELPEPHLGSGASVGAHSAQWSDRAPSTISHGSHSISGHGNGTSQQQQQHQPLHTVLEQHDSRPPGPSYHHTRPSAAPGPPPVAGAPPGPAPFANAVPPVRPQFELHRQPSRRAPVAPVLAQSPNTQDILTVYELPRADQLVNPALVPGAPGAPPGAPGSLRSRREAYFAAALDLPLEMLTEALPGEMERQLLMYQSQWDDKTIQQQQYPEEKRGTFRSLLGRSKSQASLKHSGPPSAASSDRSARGISLDPAIAVAAGTTSTLNKTRSMDAKLLQRASMTGSMGPIPGIAPGNGIGARGTQDGSAWVIPPPPPPGHANTLPRSGSLARSKSQIHAGQPAPPVAFRNDSPTLDGVQPAVRLTRRTSSRGALERGLKSSASVRTRSRTPSQSNADAATVQPTSTAAPVEQATATPGVLTSNNGLRANGNANAATETKTADRKKENAPAAGADAPEARAPGPSGKHPTAPALVKPSATSQAKSKLSAPSAPPTVVVTTPPDEASKRVKTSAAKETSKVRAASPGRIRVNSAPHTITQPRATTTPAPLASASSPIAAPASAPPSVVEPPLSPSRPSASKSGSSQKKAVPGSTKEKKRSEPSRKGAASSATSSKRQTKSRVFAWLPSRKSGEGKERAKSKAQTFQPPRSQSNRQDAAGRSQSPAVAADAVPPTRAAQRPDVSEPVQQHGQSQPANLSHHQPPPSMGSGGEQPPADDYETLPYLAEPPAQPELAPGREQFQAVPQPDGSQLYGQPVGGVAPVGYEWHQPPQDPVAAGVYGGGAMPMSPPLPLGQQAPNGPHVAFSPPPPDAYAYAGQPLPEAIHPPMSQPGAVPPPSEANAPRRGWFNLSPRFGGPSNAVEVDERQTRMSTTEGNTNLKKQITPTIEDGTSGLAYGTDPTSVVSMSSVSGNISHSASLESGMTQQVPSPSTLEERLHTARLAENSTPGSAHLPDLHSSTHTTPEQAEPVTPPPSGHITLGQGFTPLRVSLFGDGERESDWRPSKPGWNEGGSAQNDGTSGAGSASSGAPSGDWMRSGSRHGLNSSEPGPGGRTQISSDLHPSHDPHQSSGHHLNNAASGEQTPNARNTPDQTASALSPSKFDLRGKSWTETERSLSHASTPSVSEPLGLGPFLAPASFGALTEAAQDRAQQEVEASAPPPAPALGKLELDLGEYLSLEGQVHLHHCGNLRVLERVVEEEEPLPEKDRVSRVLWAADRDRADRQRADGGERTDTADTAGKAERPDQAVRRTGRARSGSVSAPRSPLLGERGMPKVSQMGGMPSAPALVAPQAMPAQHTPDPVERPMSPDPERAHEVERARRLEAAARPLEAPTAPMALGLTQLDCPVVQGLMQLGLNQLEESNAVGAASSETSNSKATQQLGPAIELTQPTKHADPSSASVLPAASAPLSAGADSASKTTGEAHNAPSAPPHLLTVASDGESAGGGPAAGLNIRTSL